MKKLSISLLALLAPALLATPALAASAPVGGGDADWGVRTSFRNYVTGPGANGTITTSEGATRNADGTFDFQPASGVLDPETRTGQVTFGGSVFFQGSPGGMTNALEVRITNPRVEIAGDSGVLYADVTSKEASGPQAGETIAYPNVDFATLDLTGIAPAVAGDSVTFSPIPAALTENGSKAFAGFYQPGAALDPISFNATLLESVAKVKAYKSAKAARKVDLAKLTCFVETCGVDAPKKLTGTIKGGPDAGRKVKVRIGAPKTVRAGAPKQVIGKLPQSAVAALGEGGKLTLKGKLTLASGDLAEKVRLKTTVKGR